MAISVFPTENNVGTISSIPVRNARELLMTAALRYAGRTAAQSYIVSGLDCTSGGLQVVNVAAGVAIINGYYLDVGATSITIPNTNGTHRIYITLNLDGSSRVSSASLLETSGGVPANSVELGRCDVSGGTLVTTSILSATKNPRVNTGSYVGDNVGTRTIYTATTPQLVILVTPTPTIHMSMLQGSSAARLKFTTTAISIGTTSATGPEIVVDGFVVAQTAGLNSTATTYSYVVFF